MDEPVTGVEAIAKAREWGAPAPLAPLILNYEVCDTHDNIERNIRRTLESKYRPFTQLLAEEHDRELSIVGFGPSLKETWKHIRGDVWACNGAHNWLIERGVIPKFAMYWDSAEVVGRFVKPHPDVTYLVASRCHEVVFKMLEGFNVFVWHAVGDKNMDEMLCEYRIPEPMVGHGSAAVTTSMLVALPLGYRKMRLFGCDSSYTGEFTHAEKSVVPEQSVEVWMNGRRFNSTTWLAGQVEDFKIIAPTLKSLGVDIELYGDGMLQECARINDFKVHIDHSMEKPCSQAT